MLFKDVKANVAMTKDKASEAAITEISRSLPFPLQDCGAGLDVAIKKAKNQEKTPVKARKGVNFKHALMPLPYVLKRFEHRLIFWLKDGIL